MLTRGFYLFIAFFLIATFQMPANNADVSAGEITGKIVDQDNSEPIAFASVALLNQEDSSVVTGVISQADGSFMLNKVPYGNYCLKVSFMGYQSEVIDGIELSRSNRKINLEALKLIESVTRLEDAVVVKERLKGEEKIDRTVFTVNDDIRKTASSGLDLLKHIPSLNVDFQENVTLEGQSDIQFYVDGILRNKDFVAQLDPQLIDKVEILTNPGVKYSADVSGVVNIVLKKGKRQGVNGSVLLPLVHPGKILANPRANVEYGNQDFRLYVGNRLHYEQFQGSEYLQTEVDKPLGTPYEYHKASNGDFSFGNNYMNYGLDWFITGNTTLNFLGEWRSNRFNKNDLFENRYYTQQELQNYFETDRESHEVTDNHYMSLFLKHLFDEEGTELTTEAYAYLHRKEGVNEYSDTYFKVDQLTEPIREVERRDQLNNRSNTLEYRLDYTFLTGAVKHELGLREMYLWMNNGFTDRHHTGTAIQNENLAGQNANPGLRVEDFNYNEHRQTLYYNVLGKWKGFSWQAGVRGEYSHLDINEASGADYFVFLPQVNLSRKFGTSNTVRFSYRRQIDRPSASQLNPFMVWKDSLHISKGNPGLDPSYENRLELSYAKNFSSNYISPKVYMRYTRDGIQDLSTTDPVTGIVTIQKENIGKQMEYGLGLNASLQVFKWWKINGHGSLFNRVVESGQSLALREKAEKMGYSFGGSSVFTIPGDVHFFLYSYYRSPYIDYQRLKYRDLLMLFGVEKSFSEQLKVQAMYNPFIRNFRYSGVITESPGYYEEWYGQVNVHHLFAVELTYRFNYGGKVKKLGRQAEYEQENGGGAL